MTALARDEYSYLIYKTPTRLTVGLIDERQTPLGVIWANTMLSNKENAVRSMQTIEWLNGG